MTLRNLLTNPSFELDAGGWTIGYVRAGVTASPALGAPVGRASASGPVAGGVPAGDVYAQVTVTGDGVASDTTSDVDVWGPPFPVTPGLPALFAVSHRADKGGLRDLLVLRWLDASGAAIGQSLYGFTAPATRWGRVFVRFTAPPGAARCRPEVWLFAPADTVARQVRLDAAYADLVLFAPDYADGDTLGWAWDGAPHRSASHQLVSDEAWRAAIEGADRRWTTALRVDWRRDGRFSHPLSDLSSLVERVTLERDIGTGLPAQVGLVVGFMASSLKATLSGRWDSPAALGMDPAQVLSPHRPDSPLAGVPVLRTPVTFDAGFETDDGVRVDRRFTGSISRYPQRSSTRTVDLDALDGASRLHAPITLPPTAQDSRGYARYGPDKYRGRMNTQWVVDHVLRRNGIFASPRFRDDAVLAATMHGSMAPEVGWGGTDDAYAPTYRASVWAEDGPFGMLAPIAGYHQGRWWLEDPITAAPGSGIGVSFWGVFGGRTWPDGTNNTVVIDLDVDARVQLVIAHDANTRPIMGILVDGVGYARSPGPAWQPPAGFEWQFCGMHVAFTADTMTTTFRINGITHSGTIPIPARPVAWSPAPEVRYYFRDRATNFSVWSSPKAPMTAGGGEWIGEFHESEADIDPGSNMLTGLPEVLGRDSLDVLRDVSDAELASLTFSPKGRPQWVTQYGRAARGRPPTREQVTAERNLSDLLATVDEAAIRNVVTATCATRLIGEWKDILTAQDVAQFVVPAKSTVQFPFLLPAGTSSMPRTGNGFARAGGTLTDQSVFFALTNDGWNSISRDPALAHRIRVMVTRADSPTVIPDPTNAVAVRIVRDSIATAKVVATNYHAFPIRFATADVYTPATDTTPASTQPGSPALLVPARLIEAGPAQPLEVRDTASVDTYGEATLPLGGSDWRQWPDAQRDVLNTVLTQCAQPRAVFEVGELPHDPDRAPGDEIDIADPDGLGTVTAYVTGITSEWSPTGGAVDRPTVRAVDPTVA